MASGRSDRVKRWRAGSLARAALRARFRRMDERPPPVMKAEQILGLLPHRYPFLLIDRVLELSDDKVLALKNVTLNEPFFQGHFAGVPIMPGVLQIGAMAQAGGILASRAAQFDPTAHVMMFMAIDA